jgi:Cu(I)/Ag(I) efflux system membrane fusion protein
MLRKVLRVLAIVVAIAFAVGVTFSGRVSAIFQHQQSTSQTTAVGSERKVLYWYDAMNPQHHYNKPGKAPDGMDLVPQYAENNATQSAGATSASEPGGERKILYWYDPMHPAYKADKAGIAPDCGMQLVPKYADDQTAKMPAGTVTIAPDKQQLIGVRTATVERQSLVRTVRTTGQLTSDETKLAHIHVKVSGYIDKGYVDYVGQLVKKGQPLFTLYSPDLVATEEE